MKDNEYQCEICKGIFETCWSEAEALEEKVKNFGDADVADMAIICDDCYQILMKQHSNKLN